MQYKEKYKKCKEVFKIFNKMALFDKYSTSNLFYLSNTKSRAIALFSNMIFKNSYGLQFFFNKKGFNYLHDSFTSINGFSMNHYFTETVFLIFAAKSDLLPSDIKYLKDNGIKIFAKNNFIPYVFKEGYGLNYPTHKEFNLILEYLYFLLSFIENESNDIDMAFSEDLLAVGIFNEEERTYDTNYIPMINLESFDKNKPVNKDFVLDNNNLNYIDTTCHLIHSYLPLEKKRKDPYPSILLICYESTELYTYNILFCKPENVVDVVYGFLDEELKKNGIPTSMKINDRKLYSHLYNTLTELNIEVEFERENDFINDIIYDILSNELDEDGNITNELDSKLVS